MAKVKYGRMGKADSEGSRKADIFLDGKRVGELLSGQGVKFSRKIGDYVPSGKVIVYDVEIRVGGKTHDETFEADEYGGSSKKALDAAKKWVVGIVARVAVMRLSKTEKKILLAMFHSRSGSFSTTVGLGRGYGKKRAGGREYDAAGGLIKKGLATLISRTSEVDTRSRVARDARYSTVVIEITDEGRALMMKSESRQTIHGKDGRFTSYNRAHTVTKDGERFQMVRTLEPIKTQGDGDKANDPPDASTAEGVVQVKQKVHDLSQRIAPQWIALSEVVK